MDSCVQNRLVKILINIHTVMLIVGAIISIVTGFVVDLLISKFTFILGYSLLRSPVVLSVAGILMLIISATGRTMGNHRIKYLRLILWLTVAILLMNLVALSLSFLDFDRAKDSVNIGLSTAMPKYSYPAFEHAIDKIQKEVHCCGISNYSDWWDMNMTIPASCCSGNVTLCTGNHPHPVGVFLEGCGEALTSTIQLYLTYFTAIVLSISVFLFFGLIIVIIEYCGCCGPYERLLNVNIV